MFEQSPKILASKEKATTKTVFTAGNGVFFLACEDLGENVMNHPLPVLFYFIHF